MKKNRLIVVLIVIVIVLGGYALHLKAIYSKLASETHKQEVAFLQQATDECSSVDPKEHALGSNGCYLNYAVQDGSVAICDKITDNLKYDCYRQIASNKNEFSICASIDPTAEPIEKDSYGINATQEKDNCYSDLAIKNKSSHMCSSISSDTIKNNCQSCADGKSDGGLCYPLNIVPNENL